MNNGFVSMGRLMTITLTRAHDNSPALLNFHPNYPFSATGFDGRRVSELPPGVPPLTGRQRRALQNYYSFQLQVIEALYRIQGVNRVCFDTPSFPPDTYATNAWDMKFGSYEVVLELDNDISFPAMWWANKGSVPVLEALYGLLGWDKQDVEVHGTSLTEAILAEQRDMSTDGLYLMDEASGVSEPFNWRLYADPPEFTLEPGPRWYSRLFRLPFSRAREEPVVLHPSDYKGPLEDIAKKRPDLISAATELLNHCPGPSTNESVLSWSPTNAGVSTPAQWDSGCKHQDAPSPIDDDQA